jgi:hypothetical protein
VLDLGVNITTEHTGIASIMRFVANDARHPSPAKDRVAFEVRETAHGFELFEDGIPVERLAYPIDALLRLTPRLYARAFAPYAGSRAALLFAGCARVGDNRLLLIGDEDSGRTALLARLLRAGHAVEGDWCVIARDGTVTPAARALHVDQQTLDAESLGEDRPFVQDALLRKVWHVDTGAELRSGAIDAMVVVENRSGGRSRLEEAPQYETAQDAVAALGMFGGEPSPSPSVVAARVAEACAIVNGASCRRLKLGDLDEAVTLLGRMQTPPRGVG